MTHAAGSALNRIAQPGVTMEWTCANGALSCDGWAARFHEKRIGVCQIVFLAPVFHTGRVAQP